MATRCTCTVVNVADLVGNYIRRSVWETNMDLLNFGEWTTVAQHRRQKNMGGSSLEGPIAYTAKKVIDRPLGWGQADLL